MVSHHKDHLDELGGVVRKASAEPQERQHASQADVGLEDFADRHTSVAAMYKNAVRKEHKRDAYGVHLSRS